MIGLLEKLGLTRTVTADKSKKKAAEEDPRKKQGVDPSIGGAISAIQRRKQMLEDL